MYQNKDKSNYAKRSTSNNYDRSESASSSTYTTAKASSYYNHRRYSGSSKQSGYARENQAYSRSRPTFEIHEHIATLSVNPKSGWALELNVVSWNEAKPNYDLREWSEDHESMSKGLTLKEDQLYSLKLALDDYFGPEPDDELPHNNHHNDHDLPSFNENSDNIANAELKERTDALLDERAVVFQDERADVHGDGGEGQRSATGMFKDVDVLEIKLQNMCNDSCADDSCADDSPKFSQVLSKSFNENQLVEASKTDCDETVSIGVAYINKDEYMHNYSNKTINAISRQQLDDNKNNVSKPRETLSNKTECGIRNIKVDKEKVCDVDETHKGVLLSLSDDSCHIASKEVVPDEQVASDSSSETSKDKFDESNVKYLDDLSIDAADVIFNSRGSPYPSGNLSTSSREVAREASRRDHKKCITSSDCHSQGTSCQAQCDSESQFSNAKDSRYAKCREISSSIDNNREEAGVSKPTEWRGKQALENEPHLKQFLKEKAEFLDSEDFGRDEESDRVESILQKISHYNQLARGGDLRCATSNLHEAAASGSHSTKDNTAVFAHNIYSSGDSFFTKSLSIQQKCNLLDDALKEVSTCLVTLRNMQDKDINCNDALHSKSQLPEIVDLMQSILSSDLLKGYTSDSSTVDSMTTSATAKSISSNKDCPALNDEDKTAITGETFGDNLNYICQDSSKLAPEVLRVLTKTQSKLSSSSSKIVEREVASFGKAKPIKPLTCKASDTPLNANYNKAFNTTKSNNRNDSSCNTNIETKRQELSESLDLAKYKTPSSADENRINIDDASSTTSDVLSQNLSEAYSPKHITVESGVAYVGDDDNYGDDGNYSDNGDDSDDVGYADKAESSHQVNLKSVKNHLVPLKDFELTEDLAF